MKFRYWALAAMSALLLHTVVLWWWSLRQVTAQGDGPHEARWQLSLSPANEAAVPSVPATGAEDTSASMPASESDGSDPAADDSSGSEPDTYPDTEPPSEPEAFVEPESEPESEPEPEPEFRSRVESVRTDTDSAPPSRPAASAGTTRQAAAMQDPADSENPGGQPTTVPADSLPETGSASGSQALAAVEQAYGALLEQSIGRHHAYPSRALRRRLTGTAVVEFTLDEQGQVLHRQLLSSTGESLLDAAALRAIDDASPLPPPVGVAQRTFSIPLAFRPEQ